MYWNSAAPQNATARAERLFAWVDRISERVGLNVPQIVDLERLRSQPPGSFGRAWADMLDQHQLKPLTTGPRRKQLHDGIHVVTGYGTDSIGEAEVQAFLLGTKFNPANLLLSMGLGRMIRHQLARQGRSHEWQTVRDRLQQAYWRGRHSQLDPDRWQPELLWDCSLTQVQAHLGL